MLLLRYWGTGRGQPRVGQTHQERNVDETFQFPWPGRVHER